MSQAVESTGVLTEVSIESVLLDADLFVKYSSPDKAFKLLHDSLERSPRSIALREKLRDICIKQKNLNEAARQCLALVSLYIGREEFDLAYDRLQEAKLLDPRFRLLRASKPFVEHVVRTSPSIAIARRRRSGPTSHSQEISATSASSTRCKLLKAAKMTGLLVVKSDLHLGNVSFNDGKIVDAECNGHNGQVAFRDIIEINSGTFEFNISENEFPVVINIASNTNFMLDVLTELDNERAEQAGTSRHGFGIQIVVRLEPGTKG